MKTNPSADYYQTIVRASDVSGEPVGLQAPFPGWEISHAVPQPDGSTMLLWKPGQSPTPIGPTDPPELRLVEEMKVLANAPTTGGTGYARDHARAWLTKVGIPWQ